MTEWISVNDRLPHKNQDIIAYGPEFYKPIQIVYKGDVENHITLAIIGSWDTITHWMPLPDRPDSTPSYNFITMNEPGRMD